LTECALVDLAAVTSEHLRSFQHWLYHLPTQRGALRGIANQNRILSSVCGFFAFLKVEGAMAHNPAETLERAKESRGLPRQILTPREAKKILEAVDTSTALGYRDRAILEVFYATGIRNQELCNLRLNDLDLESELVRVHQGKGGKDRVVPLSSIACRILETYLAAIRPQLTKHQPSEWLFVSWRGGKIDRCNASKIVVQHAKAAGIKKHVTCHIWRHTCATHLLQNHANLRHVQEMLGHKSLATTERYLHLTLTELKAAHRRFHPREAAERKAR
jgi:integrase/recombinase XerD